MLHCAALIAGGKSTRMGHDKAAIILHGHPLWRHQLDILAGTQPGLLFVAGHCAAIPPGGASIVPDHWPDSGPLAGLATALAHATESWLLVLAVDMPAMTPAYLRTLLAHAQRTGRGAVPVLDGEWEPLAAVYPVEALTIARQMVVAHRLDMKAFIESARDAGLLDAVPVAEKERPLFVNLNTPGDLAGLV